MEGHEIFSEVAENMQVSRTLFVIFYGFPFQSNGKEALLFSTSMYIFSYFSYSSTPPWSSSRTKHQPTRAINSLNSLACLAVCAACLATKYPHRSSSLKNQRASASPHTSHIPAGSYYEFYNWCLENEPHLWEDFDVLISIMSAFSRNQEKVLLHRRSTRQRSW